MLTSYINFTETEVPNDELIVSRTDLDGYITYANDTFAEISGYTPEELIGKPHSVVRHPDMPSSVFKDMWSSIRSHKQWSGYVKNLREDGGYYWVYAEVSGVYKDGKLVEFKSLRAPVEADKKIEFQDKYDAKRREEERCCRVVADISVDNYEKLKKLSSEEGISQKRIINYALSDYLL